MTSHPNSTIAELVEAGARVRVAYNLHREQLSVRYKGRVAGYVDRVGLTDVRFLVSDAGRERVRREGVKNLHAFVEGALCPWMSDHYERVTYNPYAHDGFVLAAQPQTRVWYASSCVIEGKRIYI